jgi:hypothetical protein
MHRNAIESQHPMIAAAFSKKKAGRQPIRNPVKVSRANLATLKSPAFDEDSSQTETHYPAVWLTSHPAWHNPLENQSVEAAGFL